jgi:hypothetical protein
MMVDLEDDDGLEPWKRYEKAKNEQWAEDVAAGQAQTPMSVHGERLLTFWQQLALGTFTGAAIGTTPVALARLLKILSDADLLLAKLCGGGAIRTGVWFDPQFAVERASEAEQAQGGSNPVIETLRQVGQAWIDEGIEVKTPMTPHLLFCAMLYWAQGNEFSWATYEAMMPRLFRVSPQELLQRLHMLSEPDQQARVQATIDRVAELPVKLAAPVFVRFENPVWGLKTQDFGPYVWIELIHDELKVAPSGRHLATLHRVGDSEYWIVSDPAIPQRQTFTTVVIGPAEVPDGWTQPDDAPQPEPNEPSGPAFPSSPESGPAGDSGGISVEGFDF